jgi:hypothetical protein
VRPLSFAAVLAVLLSSPNFCSAQSIYGISIDTSRVRGSSGMLVFDMTSNMPMTNRFDVTNFSTDGAIGPPETQGEFILGDLVQDSLPAAFTRINADTFFTELALPFITFGDRINFTINVSETAPQRGRPPDEFSLYFLGHDGRWGATGSPSMSITITGERGGLLAISPEAPAIAIVETEERSDQTRPDENVPLYRRPQAPVTLTVTPAWTPVDPTFFQHAKTFEGTLTEFCHRRCAEDVAVCTGGAFGLDVDDNTFYTFDDVSNLKAQVALVYDGKNPLTEGEFGHAKVRGIVNNSVLTVQTITLF